MTLQGHTSTVRGIKMVSETTVISSSRDSTVRVWDLSSGECRKVLEGHENSVRAMAIHEDLVVSASYDKDARIWNWKKGECLKILKGHTQKLYAVEYDGKVIATSSMDCDIRVWDPVSG